MLTGMEIRNFRNLRSLSLSDVEKALKSNAKETGDKGLSKQFIGQVETGVKEMNEENYKKIIYGINKAFFDKVRLEREKVVVEDIKVIDKQEDSE